MYAQTDKAVSAGETQASSHVPEAWPAETACWTKPRVPPRMGILRLVLAGGMAPQGSGRGRSLGVRAAVAELMHPRRTTSRQVECALTSKQTRAREEAVGRVVGKHEAHGPLVKALTLLASTGRS